MKLTVQNYPTPGFDWWVLRRWPIPVDGPSDEEHERFLRESRLVPETDLEGETTDWQAIARAITGGYEERFKRVAIEPHKDGFLICSPRNWGTTDSVFITLEDALFLRDQIRQILDRRS